MATLIQDRYLERRLIARRRRLGLDRLDEVWNGMYFIAPAPNNEHQDVSGSLYWLLREVVQIAVLRRAYINVNITDRVDDWKKNFRVPDVAVFLNETNAVDHGTHWFGGPDLAIEVISKQDRIKKKIGFYSKIGARELLIVDRIPLSLSLYRLQGDRLELASQTTVESGAWIVSQVLPLTFRLITGVERPRIDVRHNDGSRTWIV